MFLTWIVISSAVTALSVETLSEVVWRERFCVCLHHRSQVYIVNPGTLVIFLIVTCWTMVRILGEISFPPGVQANEEKFCYWVHISQIFASIILSWWFKVLDYRGQPYHPTWGQAECQFKYLVSFSQEPKIPKYPYNSSFLYFLSQHT